MTSKTAAIIIGLLFIAVGALGFISNPVVGESESAIFHTDATHNFVHIFSGILFVLVALAKPANAGTLCKIFGVLYLLLGIYGLIRFGTGGMGKLLGFLHVNAADNYLHIGLGIVIFLAGMLKPNAR